MNMLYESNEHQMVVIYGRRRVGKTSLINEFCKGKRTLFFSALESTAEGNLVALSKAINNFIHPHSSINSKYTTFDDAFKEIYEETQREKLVFVIDEFPYLASADRSISSVLQHAIDRMFSKTNIFMILCGSSMSFIEDQVLGHNSPLYGRRTAQFKIEPLNYLEAAEAHPGISPETNALIYGITGGVPHYINKLAVGTDSDLGNSVVENLLERHCYLFEEPANLLKQELREPATYNSLIATMAGGAARLNEISNKTSLEYALCSKYISVLISLGIIGKKEPVCGRTKNKTLYFVKDNLFRFWYRFISDNMSLIMAGKAKLAYDLEIRPYLDHYMGITFEDICRQYLVYHADVPFPIKVIGSWWGGNPETKVPEEIDILAVNGKNSIFGECKWQSAPTDLAVLKGIKRKAELFPEFDNKYYYLFSRSGFTSGVNKAAEEDGSIRLITLTDIYNPRSAEDSPK
jgi:AAA+ ATPase superfamily predicted ATPase